MSQKGSGGLREGKFEDEDDYEEEELVHQTTR